MSRIEAMTDWFFRRDKGGSCESCGADADLRLKDGSLWCISCDLAARHMGYDNQPAKLIRSGRTHRHRERDGMMAATDQDIRYLRHCFRRYVVWFLLERVSLGFAIGCAISALVGLILLVGHSVLAAIIVFFGFAMAARYAVEAKNEAARFADDYQAGYKGALRRAEGRDSQ